VDFGLEWEPPLAATVDSFPCSPSVGKSAAKEETLGWALSRGGERSWPMQGMNAGGGERLCKSTLCFAQPPLFRDLLERATVPHEHEKSEYGTLYATCW
jgi:hypothetical protein